jgi:hypothetical protein
VQYIKEMGGGGGGRLCSIKVSSPSRAAGIRTVFAADRCSQGSQDFVGFERNFFVRSSSLTYSTLPNSGTDLNERCSDQIRGTWNTEAVHEKFRKRASRGAHPGRGAFPWFRSTSGRLCAHQAEPTASKTTQGSALLVSQHDGGVHSRPAQSGNEHSGHGGNGQNSSSGCVNLQV